MASRRLALDEIRARDFQCADADAGRPLSGYRRGFEQRAQNVHAIASAATNSRTRGMTCRATRRDSSTCGYPDRMNSSIPSCQ